MRWDNATAAKMILVLLEVCQQCLRYASVYVWDSCVECVCGMWDSCVECAAAVKIIFFKNQFF